jgi:hypothetical protein
VPRGASVPLNTKAQSIHSEDRSGRKEGRSDHTYGQLSARHDFANSGPFPINLLGDLRDLLFKSPLLVFQIARSVPVCDMMPE